MSTTACSYNVSRATRQLLKRYRPPHHAPSLRLHLYPSSFRFETQSGAFLLDSPLKDFLHFIREQKIPADLLDVLHDAGVPFYEGTLIVEIHDHRPASSGSYLMNNAVGSAGSGKRDKEAKYGFAARQIGQASGSALPDAATQAEMYRVVLWPTEETLWADLRNMDAREAKGWSDEEVLEIESRILSLTAPPLCLEPDPQATRIANLMLAASAPPAAYLPSSQSVLPQHRNQGSKRGFNSVEAEREEQGRKCRVKIMRLMERGSASQKADALSGPAHSAGAFVPTFSRMSFIQEWRMGRKPTDDPQQLIMQNAVAAPPNGTAAPVESEALPKKPAPKKRKKATDKEETAEAEDDAASLSTAPKKLSKKARLKLEKEKEEREREAAREPNENEHSQQKQGELDAAAPKKKKTKKQREAEAAAAAAVQATAIAAVAMSHSTPINAATPSVNGEAEAKTPASAKKPATKKPARPSTAKPKGGIIGQAAAAAGQSSNTGSPAPTTNGATPIMSHQQIPPPQPGGSGMPMMPMQANGMIPQQQQPGMMQQQQHGGNMMGAPPPQQGNANVNHNAMVQMQQRLLQQHVQNLVPGGLANFNQMSPQQQQMVIQQAQINATAQLGLQSGHNMFAQQQVPHQQHQQQGMMGMNGTSMQQNMGALQQNQMQQQQQHMMQPPHGLQAFQFLGAPQQQQQQQQGQPSELALGVGMPMQAQWSGMQ